MQIYILDGQEQIGPFTADELREKIRRGECTPDSLAWHEELSEWQALANVLASYVGEGETYLESSLQPVANPTQVPQQWTSAHIRAWYDRSVVIFPAAICCFPLGLLPLWLTKRFDTKTKIGLSAVIAVGIPIYLILFVAFLTSTQSGPNSMWSNRDGDKVVPYFRPTGLAPKEERGARFATKRDKLLRDAEDKLNAGDTMGAITILAGYADVLPDKQSQDLYERIRKARQEEVGALLKQADDSGRGSDPVLVPLLEELDFLVSPSLWYRERLNTLKERRSAVARTDNGVGPTSKGGSVKAAVTQHQKFRLGGFSYIIGSCERRESIGPRGLRTVASADALFVVVHYSVENETNRTETVLSDDFTLRDSKGREFRPAAKALTALMMDGENKDFILTELQPGIERDTITAFEVPYDAAAKPMILIVPEKGFGSKKVEILVQTD